MNHGIEAFFAERARCRRRTSLISAAVGLFLLAGLGALQIHAVRNAAERAIPELRFGVQGPERIVRLVRLEEATVDAGDRMRDVGRVVPHVAGGGKGEGTARARATPHATAHAGPLPTGEGDEAHDLLARLMASQGRVPIFQSEELVIEHLVKPAYPEEMRVKGVEGKVSVLALIDTLGRVVDAEVMRASGAMQLDHAAEIAVRQCLFRPYREEGARREVYAVFRFSFTLRED